VRTAGASGRGPITPSIGRRPPSRALNGEGSAADSPSR
jgi:hypothetical protein